MSDFYLNFEHPTLRGTIWGGCVARSHSCAASQLAVGFMIYRSRFAEPAAHTQSDCIRGCVTMAGRHSLLGLYQPRCGITLTVTLLAYTLVITVKMFAQKKLLWLLFVKYDNLVYI